MRKPYGWPGIALALTLAVGLLAAPAQATVAAAPSATQTATDEILPATGALWGAYLAPDDHNGLDHNTAWTNFENLIDRPMDVERVYYDWDDEWPTAQDEWSRDQGRTLYISWSANLNSGVCTPWADIASGAWDSAIDERAAGLIAFGAPVIFSFHHEPTNQPPAGGTCGTSNDFINAWKHMHDRFIADGVTNVSWALTLFALSFTNDRLDEYYAGDNYVDIIAADGYNWNGCSFHQGPWRNFQQVFQDFYNDGKAKGKPMFVAEYGTGEKTTDVNAKAQWFTDAAAQMKKWPEIKGVSYFNVGGGFPCTRYVDSSPQALAGFQAMGADPYFIAPTATTPVSITNTAFVPALVTVAQGTGVQWTNNGNTPHTVTDQSGLALFDSGSLPPGAVYTQFYLAAGAYNYKCTIHGFTGTVKVPTLASPGTGQQSTVFTVTWAADRAPTGFAFDVQIQRPGSSQWTTWQSAQTLNSATFTPDSGTGTYKFRARYRSSTSSKASKWSGPASIRVVAG
jgi:plastocyanin